MRQVDLCGADSESPHPAGSCIQRNPGSHFAFSGLSGYRAVGRFRLDVKSSAAGNYVDILDGTSGNQVLLNQGTIYASLVSANGRLYVSDREGTTLVLEPTWKDFSVLAVNRLEDGFNASMVILGDEIFLRGRSLYCIGESDGE